MNFVHLELEGAIATMTLDQPGGNRINFQMRKEILQTVERVAASDTRVLLVKGKGPDFCLGGDIRDWPGIPAKDLRPRVEVFARAIDLLESLAMPTIAVVRGGCMGGGFELALGCDLIIAAKSARFMFPEALLGIMTLQGGVYQLAERIGRTKALMHIWRDRGRTEARRQLYDMSMPLFDTPDVQSALRNAVAAVDAGLPIPKPVFPMRSDR